MRSRSPHPIRAPDRLTRSAPSWSPQTYITPPMTVDSPCAVHREDPAEPRERLLLELDLDRYPVAAGGCANDVRSMATMVVAPEIAPVRLPRPAWIVEQFAVADESPVAEPQPRRCPGAPAMVCPPGRSRRSRWPQWQSQHAHPGPRSHEQRALAAGHRIAREPPFLLQAPGVAAGGHLAPPHRAPPRIQRRRPHPRQPPQSLQRRRPRT